MTIEQQLRATWKRERRFCHVRGLCRSVIWLVMLVLLGLIIDFGLLFKTRMPAALSVLMGVAGVATMGWVIWREWIRKLRPYDAIRTALDVEAMHPELMSSLVSYIELDSTARTSDASPELLAAMRDFAVQKSSQIRFSDVIDFTQIKKLLAFASVVLLVAAGSGVRWSEHFGVMFRRLAGIDTTYPVQTRLVKITGDVTVPAGQTAEITAAAGGVIPDVAILHVRPAEGRKHKWMELPMAGLANGFSFRRGLEALDRDMDYFVTMGDYRSGEFRISVVSAPRVVETVVQLHLPKYLNRPDETTDQLNVEVPEGTRIDWRLTCDKTVGKLTVVRGDQRLDAQVGESGEDVSFSLTADKAFNYTFAWTEGDSGKNFHFEDVEYSVRVIRDATPRIGFIGKPPHGLATMDRIVRLNWQAKDDHGLDKLWLVCSATMPGDAEVPEPLRLLVQEFDGKTAGADTYEWTPAKVIPDLKPGMELSYHLEASDQKPGGKGAHSARSPVRQLTIVSKADYMAWFRQELAARNELVKETFVAERAASRKLKLLMLEQGGTE
ncbi:MAG: hypothetical protein HN919_03035 [Verrucomicrobia bacterium]|jgi:hypothetical protein|nr:hypothetical protein [Verrucomicrobiota bacterium]MBT7065251.1 hypothetical protein [Verrucomicrobiota bacterium]MBT7702160.1 hypothetical protein [Verrucomicrobiota bacterium]